MKKRTKYILLIIPVVLIATLSLSLGTTFISPLEIISMLFDDTRLREYQIIMSLRFPRLIMALIIGSSLAVSGVFFQAILKNPLSDPFILGVSSGAAFGACLAIVFSMSSLVITLAAFAGSMSISAFVYFISKRRHFGTTSLVLSGVSLNFIFSSSILLVFSLVRAEQVHKVFFWMMGDLSIARYSMLTGAVPFCLVLILFSYKYHKHLDIIAFGNEFAYTLGITEKDIRNLFWIASILAAVSVSLAGIIGFVGLIIPHIVRSIFGPVHKNLIFLSALVGGLFLAACDTLGRTIAPPYEIPIGVITGFFGGIFFLIMIMRKGDRL
ncbi:MAG: iron ABC transporter permease [bacterium]|nr:iron ABC transporter permease [bacterium]